MAVGTKERVRAYREIALEAPDGALDPLAPVPEGMVAWRNAGNGFAVVACHYTADPEKRNDAWYTEACKNLREDQIERELEINFDSKAGAKAFPFLEHNAAIYRCDPPSPIPAHWKIVIGLDYGARNPTSAHFYAVDEYRRFWVLDEFYCPMKQYERQGGLPGFAEWLKNHPLYPRARHIIGDPSIFNKSQNVLTTKETGGKAWGTLMSVAELLQRQGIHKLQRGNNDRLAGITRVHQMFNWRGDPHTTNPCLFIGKKCPKMWWELINLVHKADDDEGKNADEDVIKRNDHAFDDLKYALLSEDIPASPPERDPRAGFASLQAIENEIDERYAKENKDDLEACFDDLDEDPWDDVENF